MKLIDCLHIGARPMSEFTFGGEVSIAPDPRLASDEAWADYVFNRDNTPGVKREWWYHTPSGMWFVFERNTVTDEILGQLEISKVQHER